MELKIDFFSDWIEILKQKLIKMGYSIPAHASPHEISNLFFNAKRRQISPAHRSIKKSATFTCPPEHQSGLQELEEKAIKGENLNPHLSRSLTDVEYNDALLNDWGIYHFHLGTQIDSDGFVKRTGPLLFALISSSDFCEVNIYDHGNWTNLDIIEIIHAEWPDKIAHFRLKNVLGLSYIPSSKDIKTSRKANVVSALQTKDGTVYLPPGGGFMTDGTSMLVALESNRYIKYVRELECFLRDNLDMIAKNLNSDNSTLINPLNVILLLEENVLFAGFPDFETKIKLKEI